MQHEDDSTPKRVRPWVPMDVDWWPDAIAAISKPWPWGMVMLDLRWLDDRVRMGVAGRIPGRPALRQRWGWTDYRVRLALRSDEWASPTRIASSSPADRQRIASGSPASGRANAGHGEDIASGSPADRQRIARKDPHARRRQTSEDRRQKTEATTAAPTTKPAPHSPPVADAPYPCPAPHLPIDLTDSPDSGPSPSEAIEVYDWSRSIAKSAVRPARQAGEPPPTPVQVQADVVRLMSIVRSVIPKARTQGTSAKTIASLMRSSGMTWPETVDGLALVLTAAQACGERSWVWLRDNGYSTKLSTLCVQRSWDDRLAAAKRHAARECVCGAVDRARAAQEAEQAHRAQNSKDTRSPEERARVAKMCADKLAEVRAKRAAARRDSGVF